VRATPFWSQAFTAVVAAAAALSGAWVSSLSRLNREQRMRAAERRQVFQLQTLTALDDAIHELYLAAHQHYVQHAIRQRPPKGVIPVQGVPEHVQQPADLVLGLNERVLDNAARAQVRAFRDAILDLVTTQQVDKLEDRMEAIAQQSKDLHQRLGQLLRGLFGH
jgi:hypothetical protein